MKSKHFERKIPKRLIVATVITSLSLVFITIMSCILSFLGILESYTFKCIVTFIITVFFFLCLGWILHLLFFPVFDFYIKIENELIHIEFSEEEKYTFNKKDFAFKKIRYLRRILIDCDDKSFLTIPYNEDVEQFLQELSS